MGKLEVKGVIMLDGTVMNGMDITSGPRAKGCGRTTGSYMWRNISSTWADLSGFLFLAAWGT